METGNIIIILVSLLAFIIPFVWMSRSGKKSKKEIVKSMEIYAKNLQFQLNDWETEAHFALGIDHHNKIAFFISKNENGNLEMQHAQLLKTRVCQLNRQTRTVKTANGKEEITRLLEIIFFPKNKGDETVIFTTFSEDNNSMIGNELIVSKKWIDIFNRNLK